MIYYITKQYKGGDNPPFIILDNFKNLYEFMEHNHIVALDTETQGLMFTQDIYLLQLGTSEAQFVINFKEFEEETLELLRIYSHTEYIIHHAQFDLRFLMYRKVYLKNIFDTCVTEKVLVNGLGTSASLKFVAQKYLNIELDKTVRGQIHKGITNSVIVYAANDVKYLHDIKKKQLEDSKIKQLDNSIKLQNKFVYVLAKMIVNGIYLNWDKWLNKVSKYDKELSILKEDLNQSIISDSRYSKYIDTQLSMFEPVKIKINWASSKQVIQFMKDLGVDTKIKDKEKGGFKDSVESKHLDKYKKLSPIIPLYLKYKEVDKELSTYGLNWKSYINKITNRIHVDFNQYLFTGRMSASPNILNIPADKETRACFTNQKEGFKILSVDYSNQETYVCAELSQDPTLLEALHKGLDLHCITGTAISHIFLGNTQEVTKDNGLKNSKGIKIRDIAKIVNFSIQYLCQPPSLATNLGCSLEEATEIHKATVAKYKRRHDLFEETFIKAIKIGYIQYNDIIKSKFFIKEWDYIKEILTKYNYSYINGEFQFKNIPFEEKKKFSKLISIIKRSCANYIIQGTSSDMIKLSGIYINEYIEENNLQDKAMLVNSIYDENLLEVHESIAEEFTLKVVELMNKAADVFCKTVKLTAEPALNNFWEK